MTISWLPYASAAAPAFPPRRPSALSLRPAVVVPLFVSLLLVSTTVWGGARLRSQPPPTDARASLSAPAAPPPASLLAWSPAIRRWATEYDVPTPLVAVVMTLESCGDPSARSRAGALGLFQVMPFHFQPGENPFDPETNARRGLGYLKRALEIAGGDWSLALAGYNGGVGVIGRDPRTWPAETMRYVTRGTLLLGGFPSGDTASGGTLEGWLEAESAALCRRGPTG
jgi:soluble lytic murein transglycosylase-like protein